MNEEQKKVIAEIAAQIRPLQQDDIIVRGGAVAAFFNGEPYEAVSQQLKGHGIKIPTELHGDKQAKKYFIDLISDLLPKELQATRRAHQGRDELFADI